MVKHVWFGSSTKSSVGKVRLKHRELFVDESLKKASVGVIEEAAKRVRKTISWLSHPNADKVKSAFGLYFKDPSASPGSVTAVQAVLELLINGMTSGKLALKTDNSSSERLQGFGVAKGDVQYIEGYVRGVGTKGVGDIHVTRNYILNNQFQAVRTFIHEGTHRFAATQDFGEQGYMYSDGSDFREPGITADECLTNADSYAYFCMALGA